MHNSEESDKKMNKAKSFNAHTPLAPSTKLKIETAKKTSFDLNNAVRSLDIAYRLKKSKLVNGECVTAPTTTQQRSVYPEMFMDVSSSPNYPGMDNASLMSMNFSHYELMRNLSSSLCNSDGAFSNTTCSARMSSLDNNVIKNEHLERYFRSFEMWSPKCKDEGPSSLNLHGPDK